MSNVFPIIFKKQYVTETFDNLKHLHFKIFPLLNYFCSFRSSWGESILLGGNLYLVLTQKMKALQKSLGHTGH